MSCLTIRAVINDNYFYRLVNLIVGGQRTMIQDKYIDLYARNSGLRDNSPIG